MQPSVRYGLVFYPPLVLALFACNAYNQCMQYTIRQVPRSLDEALRRAARERGKA